jgi:ribosome maturation factor RimP
MPGEESMSALQAEIETRLNEAEPDVEVLLAEVVSGGVLRLFIDHPDGVTLGLCERVSGRLTEYRDRYALEVSSPGRDRPLTKPSHYRRFLGARARVRLRGDAACAGGAGPRTVTGELVGATDADVTIAAPEGVVTIPLGAIARSNLVPGD